jgi:hypothetical protein
MFDAFQTVFAIAFIATIAGLAAFPPLVLALWPGGRGTIGQGLGEVGLGDVIVGATAPFVARAIARKPGKNLGWVLAHAWMGLANFVSAIATAVLLGANLAWPAQMIPTFLVPLAILMHIWLLNALWRTRGASTIPTLIRKRQRS